MKQSRNQAAFGTTEFEGFSTDSSSVSVERSVIEELLRNSPMPVMPQPGDTVVGRLIKDLGKELLVDIGSKADALLHKDLAGGLKVGDEAKFIVIGEPDEKSEMVPLSHSHYLQKEKYDQAWAHVLELKASGALGQATVASLAKRKADDKVSGVLVEIAGLRGFIRLGDLSAFDGVQTMVDTHAVLPVKVISANRRKNELKLSHREALTQKQSTFVSSLKIGDVLTGTVSGFLRHKGDGYENGVFVAFADGSSGLVRRGELTPDRGIKPSEFVQIGQQIEVVVIELDQENGKVSLSHKQAPCVRRLFEEQRSAALAPLCPGQIVLAKVIEIKFERDGRNVRDRNAQRREIGVVLALGEATCFVHKTDISNERGAKPSDVLAVGDEIGVLVTAVDAAAGRLSVNIADVDQTALREIVANSGDLSLCLKSVQERVFTDSLAIGESFSGTVRNKKDFGAFVHIGHGVEALLHVSDIPGGSKRLHELNRGETLEVTINSITDGGNRKLVGVCLKQSS